MKRKLLSLTLVLALVLSLVPMGAFAADVSAAAGSTVTAANLAPNATTTYTVSFDNTGQTAVLANGTIVVTFDAATDLSGVNKDTDIAFTTANGLTYSAANSSVNNAAHTVTISSSTAQTAAGVFAFTIANVKNRPTAGATTVGVATAADTISETVTLALPSTQDNYVSTMSVDKTQATADGSTEVVFTVYVMTSAGAAVPYAPVYFQSNRAGTDTFVGKTYSDATATPGTLNSAKFLTTDSTGKVEFKVTSNAPGVAKIGVGLASPVAPASYQQYLNGLSDTNTNATTLKMIGTKDITFTAASLGSITLVGTAKKDISGNAIATVKANGTDYYEYTFRATSGAAGAGSSVSGETVNFITNDAKVTFNANSAVADAAGTVKVKVYATKPGTGTTFVINAKVGNTMSPDVNPVFVANGVTNLQLISSQDQKIAKTDTASFKIKLMDSLGNEVQIKTAGDLAALGTTVKTTVQTEPSDSSLATPTLASNADGYLRVNTAALNKEGNYVIRVALDNGKYVDIKFSVKKQGTITGLNFTYDANIFQYQTIGGGNYAVPTSGLTLERVDAEGVALSVSLPASYMTFTSSDNSVATISNTAAITMIDNKDNVGKKVTLTAIDSENKLSKSIEVTVGGIMSAVKAEAPATAAVGIDAPVKVTMVDNKGNLVGGFVQTGSKYIVLEAPAGAIVSASEAGNFAGNLKDKGYATLNVSSNKAGKVVLQVVQTAGAVSYSGVVTIDFGAEALVAAKTLVLNMGSTTGFMNNNAVSSDLAPFIKDGRAFVPVSFIAAQLGGTAEFTKNAAGLVDTVTVKAGTTTVTMTIGSTTIKVLKDGKESTVTTDVAPFIKSGRTVLPFRAIAEAMGAKVSFGPATGSVEWVKFEM